MKKLLFGLAILFSLVVAIIVLMYFFKICPPVGPWPSPPWCANTFTRHTYSVSTNAQTLPQIKAVNMADTWGRNYNMGMVENTRNNIISSFERVKALGAKEVYVHDFDRAVFADNADYTTTNYTIEDEIFWNDMRDESMTESDIQLLATTAHTNGLKLGIKRNMSFVNIGKYIKEGISGGIQSAVEKDYANFNSGHSEEWIRDYFSKWQDRLVAKASMYEKYGVDIMSISPTWMGPTFASHEQLANELQRELLAKIRTVFSGKIHVEISRYGFLDGKDGSENWQLYDYYKLADVIEMRVYDLPGPYRSFSTEESISRYLSDLNKKAELKNVKLSIFFAPSSYANSLNKGALEVLDYRSEAVKNVVADYEYQTKVFDLLFQDLMSMNNIERINVASYAWDDALDPQIKPKLSVASTFRNKPAEVLITQWFNK